MPWSHSGFEPRIVYYTKTSTWRCLVRELPATGEGGFRSLEGPGLPSHASPDTALASASAALSALLSARQEASAVEVVRLLVAGRLRPTQAVDISTIESTTQSENASEGAIMTGMSVAPPAPPAPLTFPSSSPLLWQAQRDDGTWTSLVSSPYKALESLKQ